MLQLLTLNKGSRVYLVSIEDVEDEFRKLAGVAMREELLVDVRKLLWNKIHLSETVHLYGVVYVYV